jgi:hypothetical protein
MNAQRPFPRSFLSLSLALAGLILVGCASTATRSSDESGKIIDLKRGMTMSQVQALIGKPAEIRSPERTNSPVEVWVYHRKIGARVDAVAPTVTEEPWIDPITNQLFYLESPEASERRVEFIEELTLYFASGLLTEANRTVRQESQFTH